MPDLSLVDHRRNQRLHEAGRGSVREFLVFTVADELYGVELVKVREILSPPPITVVPRARSEVVGVCSVRGLLVTVVDLRVRLGRAQSGGRKSRILLTDVGEEVMGLLVDEVRQVMRLSESEIEPAAAALGSDVSDHVIGIGRPAGSVVILLDLAAAVLR
jgi:chemotaxis signal transduction protein